MHGRKGKKLTHKKNITRCIDPPGGEVKALVPFMESAISQEDTSFRTKL
jgi:hypothetical protein